MSRRAASATAALAWLLAAASGHVAAEATAGSRLSQPTASGLVTANIDASTPASKDLFVHANGAWLRDVAIPDDRSTWGVDSIMTEEVRLQLRGLLEEAARSASASSRKAGAFYASFMDEKSVDASGVAPLKEALDRIAGAGSIEDLGLVMATLSQWGVNMPLVPSVRVDARQSTRYVVTFWQGGLGLPDRDYYLLDDEKFRSTRQAYRAHIGRMLGLLGEHDDAAMAAAVFDLETALATVSWTRVETRDREKTYNPTTAAQMAAMSAGLFGAPYLRTLDLPAGAPLVLGQPSFFRAVGSLSRDVPLPVWKGYLRWRLVAAFAPYLPAPFVAENFAFRGKVLAGVPVLSERWKRGVALADDEVGEIAGRLYVDRYFPPATKAKIDALVANVIEAYRLSIDELDWMEPATKAEARAKLAALHVKVGYPDHWRDYSALRVDPADLIGNIERSRSFEWQRNIAKLARPVDHDDWGMTAPTVNAYFNASLNEIVFPAGILQPPMYNPAASDAYNYGATGATIGHEISHGFDDQGSRFDSRGNLRDWWTAEDRRRYKERADKLVAQFGHYEPVPGFMLNGSLSLGENIADLAGVEIAYLAYTLSLGGRPAAVIDGYTGDQLFYLGYAQSYLNKVRPETALARLKSDPHAPDEFRVNGIVVHVPSFYGAFDVKPTDAMYLAPEARIHFWRGALQR